MRATGQIFPNLIEMRHLTVQERSLIFTVLAILLVGACVKHFRQVRVVSQPQGLQMPEQLQMPPEPSPGPLPSINDLDEDDD